MSNAKRRFGQNFLVDRNVVDRIIAAVNPQSDQTIIEIGPGRGALTSLLIEKAKRVVAIEFDRDLVAQLHALAKERGTGLNEVTAELLKQGLKAK